MYSISQLNDLLVPELLDIAEELGIANAKKLHKQDLIQHILDKQSAMTADKKNEGDKPKRKRIAKKSDDGPPAREEQEVKKDPVPARVKKAEAPVRPAARKTRQEPEEEEELQPITDEQSTVPPAIAQM